jgi:hypothetical protein
MRLRPWLLASAFFLLTLGALFAQREFRQYIGAEYYDFPLPPDAGEKTEFVFARLRYQTHPVYRGLGFRGSNEWWTIDYPRADRHILEGIRRLTRLNARSVEQVTDLEDDDVFNWPWLYVVEPGHWNLTDEQCKKLREYLLRGGFLMTDDFHGTFEWEIFMQAISRVFPDRPVVDLDAKDPIFHVLYDLDDKFQVPGAQYFYSGRSYEQDGFEARWRGIYDDKGRIMVAICHNMDLGDAVEHSDEPRYPEKWASMAYRIWVNYVIYAMTH